MYCNYSGQPEALAAEGVPITWIMPARGAFKCEAAPRVQLFRTISEQLQHLVDKGQQPLLMIYDQGPEYVVIRRSRILSLSHFLFPH